MDGRGNRVARNEDWDEAGWDLFDEPAESVVHRPPLVGQVVPGVGLECMRLSTVSDRDDARSTALIHEALDLGVRLFDTADSYCLDAAEAGHNERLLSAALESWSGDRDRVVVASKVGLIRPGGAGSPMGARSACWPRGVRQWLGGTRPAPRRGHGRGHRRVQRRRRTARAGTGRLCGVRRAVRPVAMGRQRDARGRALPRAGHPVHRPQSVRRASQGGEEPRWQLGRRGARVPCRARRVRHPRLHTVRDAPGLCGVGGRGAAHHRLAGVGQDLAGRCAGGPRLRPPEPGRARRLAG
ncbi:MAG: hypothetical protein GY884_22025 [Proteobacteria bacterium]|nr:hypothetical protein [Pseudomonadota bacterium]